MIHGIQVIMCLCNHEWTRIHTNFCRLAAGAVNAATVAAAVPAASPTHCRRYACLYSSTTGNDVLQEVETPVTASPIPITTPHHRRLITDHSTDQLRPRSRNWARSWCRSNP